MATTSQTQHGIGRFTTAQFTLRQALAAASPLEKHKRERDKLLREKREVIRKARPA